MVSTLAWILIAAIQQNEPKVTARQAYGPAKKAAETWAADAKLVSVRYGTCWVGGASSRWDFTFVSWAGCRPGLVQSRTFLVGTVREGRMTEAEKSGSFFILGEKEVSGPVGYAPLPEPWLDSDDAHRVFAKAAPKDTQISAILQVRFGLPVWSRTDGIGQWVDMKGKYVGWTGNDGSKFVSEELPKRGYYKPVPIDQAWTAIREYLKVWGEVGDLRVGYVSAVPCAFEDFRTKGTVWKLDATVYVSKPEIRRVRVTVVNGAGFPGEGTASAERAEYDQAVWTDLSKFNLKDILGKASEEHKFQTWREKVKNPLATRVEWSKEQAEWVYFEFRGKGAKDPGLTFRYFPEKDEFKW